MKHAPLSAAAAMLLLILGIAASKPMTPDTKVLPLDFSGIDSLTIIDEGDSADIQISDVAPAHASFNNLKKTKVTVDRRGNDMTIRTNLSGYSELDLVVPSRVRTFVLRDASIKSQGDFDQVLVRASGSIRWEGDVRHLRVEAMPRVSKCNKACGLTVNIANATIAHVEVFAPGGGVGFGHPDRIGAADLYLGPRGKVSLSDATRLGNIVLRDSASPFAQ